MNSSNILSTRVRFARNLEATPFPSNLSPEKKKELLLKVKDTAKKLFPNLDYIDAMQLTTAQAGSLMEERLISPEFANNRDGAGLLLSKDKNLAIMLNEEDHLRIQTFEKGYALDKAFKRAVETDVALDNELKFAYSENLGYLTHCPTNLGTGMRASVLVHLPALTDSGVINKTVSLIGQYGFTVRGLYGEGTRSEGGLYQISNQIAIGLTEEEILERLGEILEKIEENEASLREKYIENIEIQDKIFRAYGILQNARTISSKEAVTLLSRVRYGAEAGLLKLDFEDLDSLLVKIQPYNLCETNPQQRDIKRAQIIRNSLC